MPEDFNAKKDQILDDILKLKAAIEEKRTEYQSEQKHCLDIEEVRIEAKNELAKIEDTYKRLKKRFDEAEEEYSFASRKLRGIGEDGKKVKESLANKERELSRLLDAEKIEKEYREKILELTNKFKDAKWRKENRDDGLGALPHQIEGAVQLSLARSGLLADKMGLGKTLTSLIFLDHVDAKKILVITPNDVMSNFINEVKMWTDRKPIKLGGMSRAEREVFLEAYQDFDKFFIVLNYEAWRRDKYMVDDLIKLKFDTMILDEAHMVKEIGTNMGAGVQKIRFGANMCPLCDEPNIVRNVWNEDKASCDTCGYAGFITEFCSVKYVLPMTGTPILNKPQEMFPQLRMIDPKNFKDESYFLSAFCTQRVYEDDSGKTVRRWEWAYGGEKKIAEKIGPRFLQRDPKSAGVVIPEQKPVLHEIEMERVREFYPRQYVAYQQARQYAQIILNESEGITMSMPIVLTVILRLRQVMTWPAAIELKIPDPNDPEGKKKIVFANLEVEESIKMDKAEEIIRAALESGDRIAMFSQFTGTLEEMQRRIGDRSIIYYGETPQKLREEIKKDFDAKTTDYGTPDNKPKWDVALCNYKAAGQGLNLHGARQMIVLDEEWNPGKQDQAKGRISRIGTTKETIVHTIQVENSVDTWMADLIQQKRNIVEGFESAASSKDLAAKALKAIVEGKM